MAPADRHPSPDRLRAVPDDTIDFELEIAAEQDDSAFVAALANALYNDWCASAGDRAAQPVMSLRAA
jgi:hypothetical protein